MKSLGTKMKNMYGPEMAGQPKDEMHYPEVRLPGSFARDNDLEVDDEVTLTVKGKVTGCNHDKYSDSVTIELHDGECTEKVDKTDDDKSMLEKAK